MEHKSRRPDILVDEELIFAFYDARIPEGVHNGADFEKWRKEAERADPKLLFLRREDLMRHEAAGITTENFPTDRLVRTGSSSNTTSSPVPQGRRHHDGAAALLNQVLRCREWLVPGLLKEKAVPRAAPAALRHKLGLLDASPRFRRLGACVRHAALQRRSRATSARSSASTPPDAFRPDSALLTCR